jgi:iron complex outermembrane receptor protein
MTRNEIMGVQLGQATQKLQTLAGGVMGGTIPLPLTQEQLNSATSSYQPTTEDNVKHTNTPDFWGMAGLVYKPITKLDISSYGYYYGSQTLVGLNGDAKVDSKFILNLKVAYKPIAKTEVYVNAKNLLNNTSNEFAYMDEIGGIYMVGMRFNF